jgi:hypothetical protein
MSNWTFASSSSGSSPHANYVVIDVNQLRASQDQAWWNGHQRGAADAYTIERDYMMSKLREWFRDPTVSIELRAKFQEAYQELADTPHYIELLVKPCPEMQK